MCGIVGFTGPGPDAAAVLGAMMAPIGYRGPDQRDTFVDASIAAGHLRLTIIDPVGGRQPRRDPATGDVLVYNGEIYDFARHAEALRAQGIALRDASDTEVLFQMIRLHGVSETLRRVDGMFAFVYRDGASGTVTLARDRFGEKPLFYAVIRGQLVFASEIKALRHHPACAGLGFDLAAIGQYLTFDYVPAPRTGFEAVRKLLPGHIAEFDGNAIREAPYWRFPAGEDAGDAASVPADEEAALDRLEALLRGSIESRLVADVPVGLFLSGGIDSALLAALASDYAPGIAAYTIKLPDDSYDETPYARAVADRFGLKHTVREVAGAEVLSALDRIEGQLDEPFADPSIVPTYLLCETAREGVTVALGGDGGDELFAGYINFKARKLAKLMSRIPSHLAAPLGRALGALPTSDRYMGLAFKLAQLSQGFGHPVEQQSFLWMAPFGRAARKRLIAGGIPAEEDFGPIYDRLERYDARSPLDELQYLFSTLYLPDDILTKVDRASMYHSLEVRAPFLSPEVARFAMGLPAEWRVNGFETKYLLRRLAARHLPPTIARRPKHGFGLPVASLLRDALRERVHDVLLDRENPLADYFARGEIERLLATHMRRQRDHRKRIWSLYALFRFAAQAKAGSVQLAEGQPTPRVTEPMRHAV